MRFVFFDKEPEPDLDELTLYEAAMALQNGLLAHATGGSIADAGARRISTGGRLTWVAVNALVDAATAIRDHGDFSSLDRPPDFEKWLAP